MRSRYDSQTKKRKEIRGGIRKKQKIILLCTSLAVLFIVAILIVTIKIGYFNKNLEVSADILENTSESTEEYTLDNDGKNDSGKDNSSKENSDNSGYLKLEDDPNAEDALQVFANTEGLLKGTKQYPVRTDGKKIVYLTFDDGPSTENTPNVLKTLEQYGVKATFFVTGKSVDSGEESKKLLKQIAKNGHAIGNHTYSHDYNKLYPGRTIDSNAFMAEIDKCNESLKSVLGKDFSTRVIRFPGGYWSWNGRTGIRPVIDEKGYAIIDWNTLNEDAQGPKKNAEQLVQSLKKNTDALGPNADSVVVLMHDTYGKSETVKSVPQIIEYFKAKGFEFKTIK